MPGSTIPLMNKKKDEAKNKVIIIIKIAVKAALYCLKYYKYLNFK
jgi:hypothetical protein